MMGSATGLVGQLGGSDKIQSLANSFLGNVKSNPSTSSLVKDADTSTLTTKLTDQLSSMLGGNAKAPLTSEQVDAASKKNTPETNSALSDSFSKALDAVATNPTVKETINKTVGPKIGGILTGLLGK
jgi:truncated hemoglobin YjbI